MDKPKREKMKKPEKMKTVEEIEKMMGHIRRRRRKH